MGHLESVMETWRLVFLGGSAFFLLLAYVVFRGGTRYRRIHAAQRRETQDFQSRAVRAPALVVDVEEETERLYVGPYANSSFRVTYPIVQYQTSQGQSVETRVEVGIDSNPPAIGQYVEVCYDAAQPPRARLSGPGIYPPRMGQRAFSGCSMLTFGGLYVGLGILGIVLALFVPD
ncbi:MAG: DUF3592 domain-containing protein [Streptosporangiales bacterium]|nr:DUF3592 domain-containing protein [Streptosporangiales bacterium]